MIHRRTPTCLTCCWASTNPLLVPGLGLSHNSQRRPSWSWSHSRSSSELVGGSVTEEPAYPAEGKQEEYEQQLCGPAWLASGLPEAPQLCLPLLCFPQTGRLFPRRLRVRPPPEFKSVAENTFYHNPKPASGWPRLGPMPKAEPTSVTGKRRDIDWLSLGHVSNQAQDLRAGRDGSSLMVNPRPHLQPGLSFCSLDAVSPPSEGAPGARPRVEL